jgi:hypothetical protein
VHETVQIVDPVVEFFFFFFGVRDNVFRLSRSARKSIRSVHSSWNMNEFKMKRQDAKNPAIDAGGWGNVGVL